MDWEKNKYKNYNYDEYDSYDKDYDKDYENLYKENYDNEYLNDYNEDIDSDDNEENDSINIATVDKDVMEYFLDGRVASKKSTTFKKKKKDKITYKNGQAVFITNKKCNATIIYGPYELDKKQMYEIEIDNTVISIEEKYIKVLD